MGNRVVLYFGSFNPVHNGHMSIARWVEANGYGRVWMVVSPGNPLKDPVELAPPEDRLAMLRIAAGNAPEPRPEVCDIEMQLARPSYTIDTLRELGRLYPDTKFSILIGSDILGELDRWKEYETLLADYRVLVYPREGVPADRFADRIVLLAGAPLFTYSSTEVRQKLMHAQDCSAMLDAGVLAYIRERGLWMPGSAGIDALSAEIGRSPRPELYLERGKLFLHAGDFGEALNDFNRTLELDPVSTEAAQYAGMVSEILEFRYKDIYNP